MTNPGDDDRRYQALYHGFHWHVPMLFNIAELCCARWARDATASARVAIHYEHEDGTAARLSYGALQEA
ncbi:MAG TPA: hypothetical protein VFL86_15040, partial [Burkholderiaceae bacterium]|nr:hypothetical protein [Burkholderiaceae bacterium]